MELDLSFDFITDSQLEAILESHFSEAKCSYQAQSYLGSLASSGSVAEGLLTWGLYQREKEALANPAAEKYSDTKQVKPLKEWSLTALIKVSEKLKLIGPTAVDASWAVKDFRNLIHPYNLLNQSVRPDKALALNAMSSLVRIAESLRGRVSQ